MKYPYTVKFNGKWYRPNTDVPDEKEAAENNAAEEDTAVNPAENVDTSHPPDEKKGGKPKK